MKKLSVILLVILMLLSVSGCGGSKDVKDNSVNSENESNLLEDDESEDETIYDESITKKEIENIENEFLQGNKDEAEYHSKKVEVLILSNERIKDEKILFQKNSDDIPIDLSYDLQWMSDNYNDLDKNQKEIFDKLINLYVTCIPNLM